MFKVVPSVGTESIRKVPPKASSRSRIPRSPSELSPLRPKVSGTLKPTPLSRMVHRMARPSRATVTVTRVAWACREAFVSASWTSR